MNNEVVADDREVLKQAFLRGAGIPSDAIGSLTPELMELLGKLMNSCLQGTIDLLALRSLVKQEVKADVTVVVMRNNNPLKFFPDSETVLTQMLRKKMPGFMEPLESIEDAYRDLRGHQKGVVVGTRASMDKVIRRLRPERIETNLKANPLFAIVPFKRKAALWDMYCQQHHGVAGESQDQFKTLFGADFLDAYEKEVERNAGSDNG
ncbi:type VI secretion system-associated FHA domain protein TagH [Massilia sp. PAMC28688]|uniref:type VI secretion system-associated FHA domain protein TagH n=1 Tax=Massilia sp. PAMC28688 TaxID=2861283 RepID=UPI001C628DF0|nr:type VI secretion system-associated FHA domain protein TagH [Massilia sp. PAMC28688]QYF92516.1 type VI secretion system-associated FHA domain protein TagH [Massilia sp. PAMC28688]